MKGNLARLGIRGFKPTLRKAPERLEALHTPEGPPLPPNTAAGRPAPPRHGAGPTPRPRSGRLSATAPIRRPRYGCRACEGAVVQEPAPERPIDGGMATEALVVQVLVAK